MLELNRQARPQAYQQELVQSEFAGVSTEPKPTTGADGAPLVAGCLFRELDTGRVFFWDSTRWGLAAAGEINAAAMLLGELNRLLGRWLPAMAAEIRSLRLGMSEAGACVDVDSDEILSEL